MKITPTIQTLLKKRGKNAYIELFLHAKGAFLGWIAD